MWIKTKSGELLNAGKLLRISVKIRNGRRVVVGTTRPGENCEEIRLGEFNTSAAAHAYLNELELLLTKEHDNDA